MAERTLPPEAVLPWTWRSQARPVSGDPGDGPEWTFAVYSEHSLIAEIQPTDQAGEIVAEFIVRAVNLHDRLVEALRRYVTFAEPFGYERLCQEFGPPEYEGSSVSMEAWLDRVLREPVLAVFTEARGEAVTS